MSRNFIIFLSFVIFGFLFWTYGNSKKNVEFAKIPEFTEIEPIRKIRAKHRNSRTFREEKMAKILPETLVQKCENMTTQTKFQKISPLGYFVVSHVKENFRLKFW